ncbi:hypothetical protein HFU84_05740 [Acidithiobacillus sp. CV18-2]|uniref:Uncharacterized protein n=1 Tax=Igneacidithiobacillus copahuensis TaxID=2724909 RepID=A0AAE3CJ28_9PROT|nr:hypothetical protein [Igneacidithiobacillus copahuensis]MBU2754301.1 hypothetical protein [Acidithiobacillus sp. CV18-3]MBU2757676.1 hypothetical protein [Acidithiobacillus sp. BN09-2]MBU2777009.1 hypothetical protein [Acidithiobacillus sp. CV18-2]MBU2797313.1 hypothetical protein [Acidithiobacillus sp. VAN18-2]MBU2799840.1 hypothetical protein [Acidithiobacillus sp. VAN18-4]UTV82005.1 hypothetical protein MQE22_05110 [Acidithiobacillus sp. YTS05]
MPANSDSLLDRFFTRFARRSIIVHAGFPEGYFAELLKQPGGGGHFRVDVRIAPSNPPSPMDWVIHKQVLTLDLPLPLLIKVGEEELYIRHLVQGKTAGHPSEILWMMDCLGERYHARLRRSRGSLLAERGMDVSDNRIDYDFYNES